MIVTILVLILATIAVVALYLAPRVAEARIVFDTNPDKPHSFGYQMAWLAIRTRDTARVVERLGLGEVVEANWDNGLGTVYSGETGPAYLFVSPPVNGWTFVAGLALPQPMGKTFADKCTPLLLDLGSEFIEVQYFLTYPDHDYFAWARVIDGKLVRAYAITDQGVAWNKGKPTREEKLLGQKLFEVRGVKQKRRGDAAGELILYPTEAHVHQLAGKWSLDPTRLEGVATGPARGYVALAPTAWRPERLRKSA